MYVLGISYVVSHHLLESGNTCTIISIAKVKEILIPLPPIKEQQRIVAQIEKLFEQLR